MLFEELPRKEWLLMLWNYHHGHLPETDYARVKESIQSHIQARLDAERVLEIINQLRQTGHWDPSPDFPERMISSLLDKTSSGRHPRIAWFVIAFLIVLAIVLLWLRSSRHHKTEKLGEIQHIEVPLKTDSLMEIESGGLILRNTPANGLIHAPTTMQLKDPVEGMEKELDDWLESPAAGGKNQ